jgi:monofunctional biosynthetic peptidoglycan transglycosylase
MAWKRIEGTFSSGAYAPVRHEWRDLARISSHIQKAVLAGEDQRFLQHHGFDFVELEYALRDAVKDRRVRGASTITMQTARTVFLWPDRTIFRKAFEAYYTVLLEILWDKERILEVYLNTVDWGVGIMGAEAACRKYFNIGADQATPSQAALLAAILPSPHRWSPVTPGEYVSRRQKRILKDMDKMPDLKRPD